MRVLKIFTDQLRNRWSADFQTLANLSNKMVSTDLFIFISYVELLLFAFFFNQKMSVLQKLSHTELVRQCARSLLTL